MAYTTVIFDLDGTLLDTLDDLTDGVNLAMRAFLMPEHTREEVRMAVGNGVAVLMEKMVPHGRENPAFLDCLACFRREYARVAACHTHPYAGIDEMLTTLDRHGLQLAVVSNKFHDAVAALTRQYFPIIHAVAGEREDAGIRKKPAPDTVFAIMRELGASPAACVYVGDSDVDIRTAENAGIPCISVAWGFRSEPFLRAAGATQIVHTPAELADAILRH